MGHRPTSISLRVWGPGAMFTQPHFRADPMTYPVPTPSALKGLLKQIHGKKEFDWEIETIEVCKPIRYFTQKNKGVRDERDRVGGERMGSKHTSLRCFTSLCDVEYVFTARLVVNPLRTTESSAGYIQRALRRMRKGQEWGSPHFGQRGFPAAWELLEEGAARPAPLDINLDIGPMLFDLRPINPAKDQRLPLFFDAKVVGGVLHVPKALYDRERPYFQKANDDGRARPRRSEPQSIRSR